MEENEQGQVMDNKIEVLVRGFAGGSGIQFKINRKAFKQEMDMIC